MTTMLLKRILLIPQNVFRLAILKIKLCKIPFHSMIVPPYTLHGGKNIVVGKNTLINKYSWLMALPLTEESKPQIIIGSRVRISYYAHIVATHKIIIGDNVNIANSVYLSDNIHGYEDINTPIRDQPIVQKHDVIIGSDTWIGERVSIIGCTIGHHCVIGAHSVVTKDIPDYCVVVGIPAKIIKRYDFITRSWRKTNPQGEFLN